MSTRSSSRVYNNTALEVWFANVGLDWEQSFSKETLLRGREIYRKGQISGVELANEEAIVHCKFARKDTCYAVIEWTPSGPKVRSSIDGCIHMSDHSPDRGLGADSGALFALERH